MGILGGKMPKPRSRAIKHILSSEQEAANTARETSRTKEKKIQEQNAESQKRFRKSKRASGAKSYLLWDFPVSEKTREALKDNKYQHTSAWLKPLPLHYRYDGDKPLPDDMFKVATRVHTSSLGIVKTNPALGDIISLIGGGFLMEVKKQKIPKDVWGTVYDDLVELLNLFTEGKEEF
jgi:hypothetical protein